MRAKIGRPAGAKNKTRPAKTLKSVRLTNETLVLIKNLQEYTGLSEGKCIDMALGVGAPALIKQYKKARK